MARRVATGWKPGAGADFNTEPPPPQTPRLALSIPEFCKAHGISEGFFYKLKKQGEGPREMKVGARTLISFESAAEWRRAREDPRRAPGPLAATAVPPIDRPCGRGS
jgi:predicted DNA-binding transcriptional regulator AlpA